MEIAVILMALVLLLPLLFYLQRNSLKSKLGRIKRSRPEYTREDFLNFFKEKGFKPEYTALVYDKIMEWIVLKDFPLKPDDNLHVICDLRDFDDMDLIHEVCSKLGLKIPDQNVLNNLNQKYPEFTPEYLLDLVQNHSEKH